MDPNKIEVFKPSNPDEKLIADRGQYMEHNIRRVSDGKEPNLVAWSDREKFLKGKKGGGKKQDADEGEDGKKDDDQGEGDEGDGKSDAPTRDDLEKQCAELNIPFTARMKDETLAKKIAEAKGESK